MAFLIYHTRYILPYLTAPRLVLGTTNGFWCAPSKNGMLMRPSAFGTFPHLGWPLTLPLVPPLDDPSAHGTSGPGGIQPRTLAHHLPSSPIEEICQWVPRRPSSTNQGLTMSGPAAATEQHQRVEDGV